MRSFRVFLGKDLLEIARTWRVWVLPGIVLFFAITTPILTKLTPELLKSLATQPGMVIRIPPPTFRDSYAEYVGDLTQIVALAVLIAFAGGVSGERRSGTAVLVLTKPLRRGAFVAAKFVSQSLLLASAVAVGTVAFWVENVLVFGSSPVADLASATAMWMAFGLMLVAVATLFSSVMRAQSGAAGLGLLAFAALGLGNLWGPLRKYSPSGLLSIASETAAGKSPEWLWPVLTALGAAALLVGLAVWSFRRQEL